MPGHNRWDQSYSIGELRPDVVAQVVDMNDELLETLRSWGYSRIGPEAFLRDDSTVVDRARLQRAVCAVPWDREELWSNFVESSEVWGEKWRQECEPAGTR